VDELGHLSPTHLLQVSLEHHQTLEVHYQNHLLLQALDSLPGQELVPQVETTFVLVCILVSEEVH
jgi:hypothetical protein